MKNKKQINAFQLPEDYFKDFEDRLFNKLNEETLPKQTGFKVPEGYFNQVEDQLFNSLSKTKPDSKVISIFSRKTLFYAASIAAITILIFSLINTKQTLITLDEIDIASIENYIDEGNININSYDITSFYTNEDLEKFANENEFISEQSLEDYLLENIEDTSLLTE